MLLTMARKLNIPSLSGLEHPTADVPASLLLITHQFLFRLMCTLSLRPPVDIHMPRGKMNMFQDLPVLLSNNYKIASVVVFAPSSES